MTLTKVAPRPAPPYDGPAMSITTDSQEAPAEGTVAPGNESAAEVVFTIRDLSVTYGDHLAVAGVSLDIPARHITAVIGPSGCGKSTVLRSLNRMHETAPGVLVSGSILYRGLSLLDKSLDPVDVRRRIGMVFQRPNPFPKSITDNVAFGLRVNGMTDNLADRVEAALTRAALWDEVKDKLKKSAFGLSGGQQQRLCIARALAVEPDVLLMDEPCSALDPIATARIEELIKELRNDITIVIVTHNMQQAARTSDFTAFFTTQVDDSGRRAGRLVEFDATDTIFTNPGSPETEAYVTGRFG